MSALSKYVTRLVPSYALVACSLGVLGGCAQRFMLPMTAAELAQNGSGPALVAYLSQPDASAAVCDLRTTDARGPHLTALDPDQQVLLIRGLVGGQINEELWQRCAHLLLRSGTPTAAAALLGRMGAAHRQLLRSAQLEKSPVLQRRLRVLQQLYVERQVGVEVPRKPGRRLFSELQQAVAGKRLGPVAADLGQQLLAALEAERGHWAGRPVDEPALDALFASGDEPSLQVLWHRLPLPHLREAAQRRLIRLHIAASPFAEVQAAVAATEERIMTEGSYRLALAEHPPRRGWLELDRLPRRYVAVRQNLWQQTATLLGFSDERAQLSVLPELDLRAGLRFELSGISQPVGLCGPREALDPSPCVGVEDVRLDSATAYLDRRGALHFVEHLPMGDAVQLAYASALLRLPLRVGGQPLLNLDLGLRFERPAELVFSGAAPGSDGPPLTVDVNRTDSRRLVFTVFNPHRPLSAVIEEADASAFRIISRGARGFTGSQGSSGSSGFSGSECQDGSSGGSGGPGGDGGPGGNGGNIDLRYPCGQQTCSEAIALLSQVVVSQGGPGGWGGAGGRGGDGGAGGSSRSARTHIDSDGNTVTDDPGCSAGSSGSPGSDGPGGAAGPPGHPGRVTFSP